MQPSIFFLEVSYFLKKITLKNWHVQCVPNHCVPDGACLRFLSLRFCHCGSPPF